MARRYRKRSSASSIINDTAYIGSRMPWWGALIFGLLIFLVFYYLIPGWLEAKLNENSGSNIYLVIEAVYGRRIHWFQWLGVVCGLIGCFFAIRNYFINIQADHEERGIVVFFAKFIGRNIE